MHTKKPFFDQHGLGGYTIKAIIQAVFIIGLASLSAPIFAASETKTNSQPAPQFVIQGNEMQEEHMEFEERATRKMFGDEKDQEDFKEQAIRKEFGGRTKFIEPIPPVKPPAQSGVF